VPDQLEDVPVSVLERWHQTEPLRLYLYGITVPLLGVLLVYGWVTTEQLGAWLAVAAALFVGSSAAGELARRKVSSPDTVDRGLDWQHRTSYARGVEDALHTTPDKLAGLMTESAPVAVPETAELAAQGAQDRCRYIENGRRCVLRKHGRDTPHHYG
jgi:hypothetical protein